MQKRVTISQLDSGLLRLYKIICIPNRNHRPNIISRLLFILIDFKLKSLKSIYKLKSLKSIYKLKSLKSIYKLKSLKSIYKLKSLKSIYKLKSLKSTK